MSSTITGTSNSQVDVLADQMAILFIRLELGLQKQISASDSEAFSESEYFQLSIQPRIELNCQYFWKSFCVDAEYS